MEDTRETLLQETTKLYLRAGRTLDDQRLQIWEKLGIAFPQLRILFRVRSRPGIDLSSLARGIGIGVSAASQQVDKLVAKGFLARHDDPEDRRRMRLQLTDLGQQAVGEISRASHAHVESTLAVLSDEELIDLQRLLSRVLSAPSEAPASDGS